VVAPQAAARPVSNKSAEILRIFIAERLREPMSRRRREQFVGEVGGNRGEDLQGFFLTHLREPLIKSFDLGRVIHPARYRPVPFLAHFHCRRRDGHTLSVRLTKCVTDRVA